MMPGSNWSYEGFLLVARYIRLNLDGNGVLITKQSIRDMVSKENIPVYPSILYKDKITYISHDVDSTIKKDLLISLKEDVD